MIGAALPLAIVPEIEAALHRNSVCAIGVSGGKDGTAAALSVWTHLDNIGHTGPRILTHADLGLVEWKASLPECEKLAAHLGAELMVVKTNSGDLMDRWEGRWRNNVQRYVDLSCVKLILPWSTSSLRFCTSEKKAQPIAAALRKRFPNQDIVSVLGIRRQESANRAKMPVWAHDARLTRKNALGLVWNAVIEWPIEQVFAVMAAAGIAPHEAYTKYGVSRVSCVACILSSANDLRAAISCEDNHDIYRRMVALEVMSSFSFQSGKWLGDVAPHLLSEQMLAGLAWAKTQALIRELAEAELPKHLLFTKGWPTALPTAGEAELIADVRRRVSDAAGLASSCLTGEAVLIRYADLLDQKAAKERTSGLAVKNAKKESEA